MTKKTKTTEATFVVERDEVVGAWALVEKAGRYSWGGTLVSFHRTRARARAAQQRAKAGHVRYCHASFHVSKAAW